MNEEFLVTMCQQPVLNTSLPFVHTARRYYRLNVLVRHMDWVSVGFHAYVVSGKSFKLERLEEVKVVTRFP